MQALCTGPQEQVTGSAYRERDASAVQWPAGAGYRWCIQRDRVGCKHCAVACRSRLLAIHRESDASDVHWPAGAGYWRYTEKVMQVLCTGGRSRLLAVHTASVMQVLCTGPQEQVTDGAYRERVMQALCPGLQEQVTSSEYRERNTSAVHLPAGAGYGWCIQRA
ncbi:hypothetical protein NDU88_006992 [Pleurodeles waltl]|uniref:Uncharacterized protein n=1 Tax=Pleurodeles waltl TaxID=8319 RepID=A0AAV7MNX3_PLEWA|nr:hypothetical protein NDU88_006992 [Pleurodeles waltl]